MEQLKFDETMTNEAMTWALRLGELNNSITGGKGNLAGRLGELALAQHLGVEVQDDYSYDLIKDGKTIEVKTKRRTVDPQEHYDVSVAATSRHQRPDTYAFISLTFDKKDDRGWYYGVKKIWLCGYMDCDQYFSTARKMNKGQRDESNGFQTHADMYNMAISRLRGTL